MEEKYKILIYENKTWSDIPKIDNPAFKKSLYFKEGQRPWYALIISKVLDYESGVTGKNGYCVCDVSVDVPDVLRLGIFWKLENAKIFAEEYVKSKI